jgi:polysaccharide export outer membrane protein
MNIKQYNILLLISTVSISLSACNSPPPRTQKIQPIISHPVQTPKLLISTPNVITTPQVNTVQISHTVISPQDELDITVFKVPELSAKNITVEPNGIVSLPFIGAVILRGLTLQQAEKRVEKLLSKDLQNPNVTIKRTKKAIRQVTVEGAVKTPGVFPITRSMTFLQAIAMSQGLTELADTKQVIVFRDGKQYSVDLYKVRRGLSPDPVLTQNDRIVVLKSSRKIKEKKVLDYLPAVLAPLSLIM